MLRLLVFVCCLFSITGTAQQYITGTVTTQKEPLAFAQISINNNPVTLTDINGVFEFTNSTSAKEFTVSYIGFAPKTIKLKDSKFKYSIVLKASQEQLNEVVLTEQNNPANEIIALAIKNKTQNDPDQKLSSYKYTSYNKFIIDNEDFKVDVDSANFEIETLLNSSRAYLSEKVSTYEYSKEKGLKETVKGTNTAGFEKPVYELLALQLQSLSWYKEDYTVFETDYASPLSKKPFNNYRYKILDTTTGSRPAYVIYFKPKRQRAVAGLEGVLYLDTESLALQKAIGQLNGVVNIETTQEFSYLDSQDVWFPESSSVTIKPGKGGKSISVFGGNISVGQLQRKNIKKNDTISGIDADKLYLSSTSTVSDVVLNPDLALSRGNYAIEILPEAIDKPESFWETYRSEPFTDRDKATSKRVDSIVKAENIERRIDVIQNFNEGYYPIGFWDVDLRTLVKYNNYEGMRLGTGGITNQKFSKDFRLEGYGVYGFKDHTFKYSFGAGVLLREESSSWFNVNYTSDVAEVGSFVYLTDKLVYSLFEPRLVNIDFYYQHKTWRTSLQHKFTPKLLTETMFRRSHIFQTAGYRFLDDGVLYNDYRITEAVFAVRWSPFSKFLRGPRKTIEFEENFPKFSAQIVQSFDGVLEGDFNYTKIGAKIDYQIKRLNKSHTAILLEGDYSFGNIPLTHLFHAYPNAPTKETVFQRFSVAGRRSFETMYFSEFFSDKLATLQIRHTLRPLNFTTKFQPEVVLISRHAIGDSGNQENHSRPYNTLNHGYNEAGLEINKLFLGFGTSFAYRYGAYHLSDWTDNLSIKFTFYLKL
ncbi:DUF5686 family protein [Croceibacter atlanticus]|uniref:DUF5686 family protein n=1 Tax=Croceibacter atlanticus TaxID=313588 RepID=UPI002491393D|nr:DUF5686 family protein [Croceibacter atlanticus]